MRRVLLILAFMIATGNALHAQQVRVIPQLGGGMIPLQTDRVGPGFGAGLHAGADVQIQLFDHFALTSGLYLSRKQQFDQQQEITSFAETLELLLQLSGMGGIAIDSLADAVGLNLDQRVTTTSLITAYHLEVPVMATYSLEKWRFHVGGYTGLMLAARRNVETRTETPFLKVFDIAALDTTGLLQFVLPEPDETSTTTNNSTDNLQRFDAGLMAGIGFQDDRWSFSLYYSHGLMDYRMTPTPEDRLRVHRALRMMVGYTIGVRKEEDKVILE